MIPSPSLCIRNVHDKNWQTSREQPSVSERNHDRDEWDSITWGNMSLGLGGQEENTQDGSGHSSLRALRTLHLDLFFFIFHFLHGSLEAVKGL